MKDTLLFSLPSFEWLVDELLSLPHTRSIPISFRRFPNKELDLSLHGLVQKSHSIIIGTISPPETHLFSLLVLSHTLKKEGSSKVIALLPYFAYARQEKNELLKSHIAPLIGQLLKASGVDSVITIDVHSPLLKKLFPIPLHSLSPTKLFAEALQKLTFNAPIVAPDAGAIKRCRELADALQVTETSFFKKTRWGLEVSHSELIGPLTGTKAIIVDDILDTGQTLISACEKLRSYGIREIIIMVSHGLFTGSKWKKLWQLGVKRIYCLDTYPLNKRAREESNIIVLPIAPLIRENFSKICGGSSWKS